MRGPSDRTERAPGRAGAGRAPARGGTRRAAGFQVSRAAIVPTGGCCSVPQNAQPAVDHQGADKRSSCMAAIKGISLSQSSVFGRHALSLARDADGASWPPSSAQLPLAGSSTAMQLGIAFAVPYRRARCSAQSHPTVLNSKSAMLRLVVEGKVINCRHTIARSTSWSTCALHGGRGHIQSHGIGCAPGSPRGPISEHYFHESTGRHRLKSRGVSHRAR